MASQIPIRNVYYLLAYAWDQFPSDAEVAVAELACPDVENLLGMVLSQGIQRLARAGFDRTYRSTQEITSRIRGRILISESYKRQTHRQCKMACEYDELTGDTPSNAILWATCSNLIRLETLTATVRHEVRAARELLPPVTPKKLSESSFRRIQLHRNTKRYRHLLDVCHLIYRGLLPCEESGKKRFRNFLTDQATMPRIFEKFVLNFVRSHFPEAHTRAMPITWSGTWNDDAGQILPQMLTDVTVEWTDRKLILDCKYYREALLSREGRYRLHSGHLYQLNAYLQNKATESGWDAVSGALLYPAVEHELNVAMELLGHRIRIASVDLDQHWSRIEESLFATIRNSASIDTLT